MSLYTVDFETRSEVNLKTAGAWKYAVHPTTEILCMAVKKDDQPAKLWLPRRDWIRSARLQSIPILPNLWPASITSQDIIQAHNVEFERALWHYKMHIKRKFPDLNVDQCRCTAARAATHALPRSLENVCEALNLPIQKDASGRVTMLQMAKPKAPTQKLKAMYPDWKTRTFWYDDLPRLIKLFRYCLTDVEAEYALSQFLPRLIPQEYQVWLADQAINRRGVQVDIPAVLKMIEVIDTQKEDLLAELSNITKGEVTSVNQHTKMLTWLHGEGYTPDVLQKEIIDKEITSKLLSNNGRRVLEIRQTLNHASMKKYYAILKRTEEDGRARSCFMFHQASPGRWASKAIQLQNLRSRKLIADPADAVERLLRGESIEQVELIYGNRYEIASSCVRPCLIAKPGHDLICADLTAIEGMGLAWAAEQTDILQAYRDGKSLYKIAASDIYSIPYENVDAKQRQVGKISELALGYGGGWRAFMAMALSFDIMPPQDIQDLALQRMCDDTSLRLDKGIHTSEEYAFYLWGEPIKIAWRRSRREVIAFWKKLEQAALSAMENPGKHFCVRGRFTFCYAGRFLMCALPSGRNLYYYDPEIRNLHKPWGKRGLTLTYMGMKQVEGKTTTHWTRVSTHGGKLAENVIQAYCRDIIAYAMPELEERGYPLVLHCHDEVVAEVPKGHGTLTEMCSILTQPRSWTQGLPLRAHGWRGKRYRK